MKATFALLTDTPVANLVSRTAWQLHRAHRLGLSVRRLPPHISLKQPFDIEDLHGLEAYMETLARSIQPFTIELADYHLTQFPPSAPASSVLSLAVKETPYLRSLHNRLNHELADHFGECPAPFDGDSYAFHLTIAAGPSSVPAYRQALATCTQNPPQPNQFETRKLALFLYDNNDGQSDWEYLTYNILPLGNALA